MSPEQLESLQRQLERMHQNNQAHYEHSLELVEKQRAMVGRLRQAGQSWQLAQSLLDEMERSLELIRWRRAWIQSSIAEYSAHGLQGQEHPWSRRPPTNLLELICSELVTIRASGRVADQDATHEAVKAALRSVESTG